MKRFICDGKPKQEKKYKVSTVSAAIFRSANAIQSYFGNRKISTDGGITLDQIYEFLTKSGKRGTDINWFEVEEIQRRLIDEKGARLIEEETL